MPDCGNSPYHPAQHYRRQAKCPLLPLRTEYGRTIRYYTSLLIHDANLHESQVIRIGCYRCLLRNQHDMMRVAGCLQRFTYDLPPLFYTDSKKSPAEKGTSKAATNLPVTAFVSNNFPFRYSRTESQRE